MEDVIQICREAAKDAVSAYLHMTQAVYDPIINGQIRAAIDVAIDRVLDDIKEDSDAL